MKHRLQLNPALVAAFVCALLWFALWLIPFRPVPPQTTHPSARPPIAVLPAGTESTSELQSPALFALPSKRGFSGEFPESHMNLLIPSSGTDTNIPLPESGIRPSGEPEELSRYLTRSPAERTSPDQISLQEAMPELKADLPVPGARPLTPVPQPERIALFLSPEIQNRADEPPQLNVSGSLPPFVRIHLGIRPDGTVDQVLFDTPVENEALAALRSARRRDAIRTPPSVVDMRVRGVKIEGASRTPVPCANCASNRPPAAQTAGSTFVSRREEIPDDCGSASSFCDSAGADAGRPVRGGVDIRPENLPAEETERRNHLPLRRLPTNLHQHSSHPPRPLPKMRKTKRLRQAAIILIINTEVYQLRLFDFYLSINF